MTDLARWAALEREWDAWRAAGRTATFWLRDDDVARPGPRLDRLLNLTRDLPAGLAAIPARLDPSLADALRPHPAVRVLQHGYRHRNHAPSGRKKVEFGADRPADEMQAEVRAGWRRLRDLFPDRAVGIFVPPWNRIDPRLVPALPSCGPALLSVFGARTVEQRSERVNTHVDIIDWRGSRGFVGETAALDAVVRHLRARREGRADPDEPTGILCHHIDHDAGCWEFLGSLFERTRVHPAVRWLDPAEFVARP